MEMHTHSPVFVPMPLLHYSQKQKAAAAAAKKASHEHSDQVRVEEQHWAQNIASAKGLRNRLLACLMSVSFLWLTSLSVASYFTGLAILSPSFQHVNQAARYAVRITEEQRKEYSKCVQRQAPFCKADLQQFESDSRAQLARIDAANAVAVSAAYNATDECHRSVQVAQLALKTWTGLGNPVTYYCNTSSELAAATGSVAGEGGAAISLSFSAQASAYSNSTGVRSTQLPSITTAAAVCASSASCSALKSFHVVAASA
jgi:hypothetical protein